MVVLSPVLEKWLERRHGTFTSGWHEKLKATVVLPVPVASSVSLSCILRQPRDERVWQTLYSLFVTTPITVNLHLH